MAIKSSSSQQIARTFKHLIFTTSCAALIASCQSTGPRTSGSSGPSSPGPVGPIGVPGSPASPSAPTQPPPSREEAKKVAVILGPGGAKALAHVGVLKAFQQQRIPIDKIVGLEWGALIGGLYAGKGQINDVEWKLYKMEQKGLPRPKGFFSKRLGEDSIKVMDDYLTDVFGRESFGSGKIDFACPTRSVWTGVVAWQTKGSMRDGVRRCLPYPPLFKAQGNFVGGASQALEAVEWLRRDGYNVIIVVNVLGSALPAAQDSLLDQLEYAILWQEVKRSILESAHHHVEFVNVDTSAHSMIQFESKKDLIGLGEAAGRQFSADLISKYGF